MFTFTCEHCGKVYEAKTGTDKEAKLFVRKHLMNLCNKKGTDSFKWFQFFLMEDE